MLKFSQKYQTAYLLAIVATLVLVCSTQLFIQHALREKATDANLINISGRQRMFSQQLLQQVYHCHLPSSSNCQQEEINKNFVKWEDAHTIIANHPLVLEEAERNIEMRNMLSVLQEKIAKVQPLLTQAASLNSQQLQVLSQNQSTFLSTMDNMVKRLEKRSNEKLATLTCIELLLAFLTLFVLALEVLFIFRPIIRELLSQNNAIRKSRDIIKQYAYVASSDLRTPVERIIKSILKLRPLIFANQLSTDEQKAIDDIEKNALHLQYLSRDLAIYTEVLTKAPNLIIVSFWDIINDLLELMEEHIYQADAKVQVGQIPHLIKVDGKFFHLLWQHLLQNALEYRRLDAQLQITITGYGDEDNWYFSISDNGKGIPPDEKDTLFDLFRHVHFNDNQHHTGLGLPLAKQIVEQHQGKITVESQVNVGTKITIQIPRNQPQTKLRAIVPANRTLRNNQQRNLGGS